MILGDLPSGSSGCWFQGITTNYNFLVSIFFTTVLAYELLSLVRMQQGIQNYKLVYAFCWLFPLIVTLLPLSTNTYSNSDPPAGTGWCFIGNRSDSPKWSLTFWVLMSFYFWIWICIIIVCYLYINIVKQLYRATLYSDMEISGSIITLSLYPILLVFCWSFTSVVDINSSLGSNAYKNVNIEVINALALILPSLQGFLHSIIFVIRSQVIQQTWREFFQGYGKLDNLSIRGIINSNSRLAIDVDSSRGRSNSGTSFGMEMMHKPSDDNFRESDNTVFNVLSQ